MKGIKTDGLLDSEFYCKATYKLSRQFIICQETPNLTDKLDK